MSPLRTFVDKHHVLALWIIVGYLTLIGVAAVWAVIYVYRLADANHRAICGFRTDLEQRVASSKKFLADHPGVQSFTFGTVTIRRDEIQQNIITQSRTIKTLSTGDCTDVEPPPPQTLPPVVPSDPGSTG